MIKNKIKMPTLAIFIQHGIASPGQSSESGKIKVSTLELKLTVYRWHDSTYRKLKTLPKMDLK